MSNHKDISAAFIGLAKRRVGTFGKWMPTLHWIQKMDIEGLDNGKLKKALEVTGKYMTDIPDSTHGFLHVEIIKRRLSIGIKWFLCVSTPKCPDLYSTKLDNALFGKSLQASWDRWSGNEDEDEIEEAIAALEPDSSTEQAVVLLQPTASPTLPQPAMTTPTTRTVSPTAGNGSPQLTEEDSDLQEFFRSIISSECLSKADLFVPEVTVRGNLRAKLAAFGKSLAADSLVKHCQDFYKPAASVTHSVKDIEILEPCPCLKGKYGMPMSAPAMTEVATAMFNLAADVPEALQLQKHGGSKGVGKRLVAITPSSDKRRLCHNAKLWIEDIIDVATTDETPRYDIVKALISALRTFDTLAFEQVVADVPQIGYSKLKLNPELQQVMVHAAGLNFSQMRTVKSYLCYVNLDIFQPECAMRNQQVTEFVRPTSIEFKDGGTRKRPAWHIPVDDLLIWHAEQKLAANAVNYSNLCKAHVILVGDHGQGAFQMMASLLLIRRKNRRRTLSTVNEYMRTELLLEVDGLCGYIQCKHDTCDVLKDTIADPINASLLNILRGGCVTTFEDRLDDNKVKLCLGNTHTQNNVPASAAVEVLMTGDLAFYALAQGKPNMAPHWCWRCSMMKKEWSSASTGPPVGEQWTLEHMEQHLARIEDGTIDASCANEVKGIKRKMLWHIDPRNILYPPLHSNELFVNTPIKELLRWIYFRCEQLPMELLDGRLEQVEVLIHLERVAGDLKEVNQQVDFLKAEANALKPATQTVGGVRQLKFRDEDHQKDYFDNRALLEEATDEALILGKLYKDYVKDKKQVDNRVSSFEKKYFGALDQTVRQEIEHMLEQVHKIIRSAYHGGDYEGNHCRKFMRKADPVMKDMIQSLLIGIPETN